MPTKSKKQICSTCDGTKKVTKLVTEKNGTHLPVEFTIRKQVPCPKCAKRKPAKK